MPSNKNFWFAATTAIVIVVSFGLLGVKSARAYSINVNLNTDQIVSGLPSPITDLLNAGKQIWQNFTGNNVSTPIFNNSNQINLQNGFQSVNTWFTQTTGLSFTQIIKAVGGIVIWVFSFAINLIKQGLSLIK